MAEKSYDEMIKEIAQEAFDGKFGEYPFDDSRTSTDALRSEAWERIGKDYQDKWLADCRETDVGGEVMNDIEMNFRMISDKAAEKEMDQTTRDAFSLVDEIANRPKIVPIEEKDAANVPGLTPEQQAEVVRVYNEELAKMRAEEAGEKNPTEAVSTPEVNETSAPHVEFGTNTDNADRKEMEYTILNSNENGNPTEVEFRDDNGNVTGSATYEYDNDDNLVDAVFRDADGNENRISEVFGEVIALDPEVKEIFKTTLDKMDHGEDWKSYLNEARNEYISNHKEDVDAGASSDSSQWDAPDSQQQSVFEERYKYHDDKVEERRGYTVALRRDTFTSFHEMAKMYNAFRGGIEIKGKVPGVVDVVVSAYNFLGTNILDTLFFSVLRIAFEPLANRDVAKDNAITNNVDFGRTDARNVHDSGYIKDPLSTSVESERANVPQAGKFYGADMTTLEKSSDNEIKIRTTNPEQIRGRGVEYTSPSAEKVTFPDLRMVEFKENRFLVDPFGRVVDVNEKYSKLETSVKVGDYLSGLDSSSSKRISEALGNYAKENNMTVAQAKDHITNELKDRFASRIESTYSVEARALEKNVLGRETERAKTLSAQSEILNKYEALSIKAKDTEAAENAKVSGDKVKLELSDIKDRINAVRDRIRSLDTLAEKRTDRGVEPRFNDAVRSEKDAVGRTADSISFRYDKDEMRAEVRKGTEKIESAIEKYNADKPEMDKVSLNPSTGELVDRNGITEKGQYNGNQGGEFMAKDVTGPESPSDTDAYVKEHYDAEKFERVMDGDVERENNDTDKDEQKTDSVDAAPQEEIHNDNPVDKESLPENETESPDKDDADNEEDKIEKDDQDKPDLGLEQPEQDTDNDAEKAVERPEDKDGEKDTEKDVEKGKEDLNEQPGDVTKPDEPHTDDATKPDEKDKPDTEKPETDNKPDTEKPENDQADNDNKDKADNENPDENNDTSARDEELNNTDSAAAPDETLTENDSDAADTEAVADSETDETTAADTEAEEQDKNSDDTANEDREENTHDDSVDNEAGKGDVEKEEDEDDDDDDAAAVEDEEADSTTTDKADKDDVVAPGGAIDIDSKDKEGDNESIDDKDTESEDLHNFKEELSSVLEDLFGIKSDDDGGDNAFNSIDTLTGGQLEKFEADINRICDLIENLSSAENFSDVINAFADCVSDALVSELESKIDQVDKLIDFGSKLMEGLTDIFGMDNMADISEEITANVENMDVSEAINNAVDEIVNGVFDAEVTIEPDFITIDELSIGNDGLTNAITGEDINPLSEMTDAESFISDVEAGFDESLQAIEDLAPDVAPEEGFDVDGNPNDLDSKPDIDTPQTENMPEVETGEAGVEVEGAEAGAAEAAEGAEALIALL